MIWKVSGRSKKCPDHLENVAGLSKILQNHLLCAFVADLKIYAIYALYPESFCDKNLTIRKVFAFCDSAPPVVWVCKRGCLLFGIISERFVHFLGNLNFNITKSRRASDSLNPTLLNNQIPRSEIFQSKDFQSIKLQRIFSDDHHHFPGDDAGERVYIFCFCQDYLYVGHSGGMIT